MNFQSVFHRIRKSLRDFRVARGGNVAITFAFATIPIIGAVGAGFDYSHANSVKADMQAALDLTALMLAKDAATISSADLQTKAMNYFTALFNRPERGLDQFGQRDLHGKRRLPGRRQWFGQRADHLLARVRLVFDAKHHGDRLVDDQMGLHAAARCAGARQYRVDGRRRQDHRA